MIELTPTEQEKIEHFVQRFKDPEKQRASVLRIIELSSQGDTPRNIVKEVRMTLGDVGEVRMWSRRQGMW